MENFSYTSSITWPNCNIILHIHLFTEVIWGPATNRRQGKMKQFTIMQQWMTSQVVLSLTNDSSLWISSDLHSLTPHRIWLFPPTAFVWSLIWPISIWQVSLRWFYISPPQVLIKSYKYASSEHKELQEKTHRCNTVFKSYSSLCRCFLLSDQKSLPLKGEGWNGHPTFKRHCCNEEDNLQIKYSFVAFRALIKYIL